jgi:pimeloyl-ACP methyl ester carboxylesterase
MLKNTAAKHVRRIKMKQEKITFKNSKGQRLVGDLFLPEKKILSIAIFVHGYTSDRKNSKAKRLSELLPDCGVGLFSIDLSGRGDSDGKFEDTTLTQYIDDVRCSINKISEYTDNIALIGSSLGGIVSLQVASRDKRIKSLVLLSPVPIFPHKSSRPEFQPEGLKKWKERGYTLTDSGRFGKLKINYTYFEDSLKYGNYSVYKKINIPSIIIHGDLDESVPIEESKELIKHLKKSKLSIIKGADHRYSNPANFEEMINETVNFLVEVSK